MEDLKDIVEKVTALLEKADAVGDCDTPTTLNSLFFTLHVACQAQLGSLVGRSLGAVEHEATRKADSQSALQCAQRIVKNFM